ncbi:MAG TPA: PadR family transcriptional regulator [Gemmatimonadaceae bacterium]|nr:PadR family transcriptional regulator [Gemmatimonadaceae bacterium]
MLGELEQVVMLATLRLDGDGYGVTIQEAIRRATGRNLTIGTIHKTLVRLEAKGLIASRMGDASPVRGGRAKRHYRVTTTGLRTLRAGINALRRLANGLAVGLEPS